MKQDLTLPLPTDIGLAIITYINKERKNKIKDTNEHIFIRSKFPMSSV
ncbi:MAG: hypothetical protein Q4G04_06165 [bacterium]|nr:hypothetical protein [bacterium]